MDLANLFSHLCDFIKSATPDEALPLSFDYISMVLSDSTKARVFWSLQFWALPSAIVLGNCSHVVFPSKLHIPLQHLNNLGHRSYATVDSVLDVMNKKRYARKVFHPLARRRMVVAGFQKEMEVIRKLKTHCHIVTYVGSYVAGSELGILLSPIADHDMREFPTPMDEDLLINSHPVPRRSLGCLISGSAFMHSNGIRHKDIKPAKVLIHGTNFLFADFGLALDFDRLDTVRTIFILYRRLFEEV